MNDVLGPSDKLCQQQNTALEQQRRDKSAFRVTKHNRKRQGVYWYRAIGAGVNSDLDSWRLCWKKRRLPVSAPRKEPSPLIQFAVQTPAHTPQPGHQTTSHPSIHTCVGFCR